MKQNKRVIERTKCDDLTLNYIGVFPNEKLVFISGGKSVGRKGIINIYRSALECAFNGWNIAYIPSSPFSSVIERAIYEADKSSLFAFVPKGLNLVSSSLLSRCLLTGGGVLSVMNRDEMFSYEALMATYYAASYISSGTIAFEENRYTIPHYLESAIDEGKFVAISKTALTSIAYRKLYEEGCYVFHTFSDCLSNSSYITYPDEKGKYAIMGERFSILNREGYEKPRIHR